MLVVDHRPLETRFYCLFVVKKVQRLCRRFYPLIRLNEKK
jgi:hypothetical protein